MDLSDFLNSINENKTNLIRTSDSPDAAEKMYPAFAVNRSLSYIADCVMLLNELNVRGLAEHGVDNLRKYEFLLYVISKKRRFSRWAKPQADERVDVIMESLSYSMEKAKQVADLFTEDQINVMKARLHKGGKENAKKG